MKTMNHDTATSSDTAGQHLSKWKRFISWSAAQEENRIMWISLAILGHGCVITILTVTAIIFSGNHFILWPFAIGAMGMSVVSYLASLPTRITIPVFFISVLIDVVIIIICFINGFSLYPVFT